MSKQYSGLLRFAQSASERHHNHSSVETINISDDLLHIAACNCVMCFFLGSYIIIIYICHDRPLNRHCFWLPGGFAKFIQPIVNGFIHTDRNGVVFFFRSGHIFISFPSCQVWDAANKGRQFYSVQMVSSPQILRIFMRRGFLSEQMRPSQKFLVCLPLTIT